MTFLSKEEAAYRLTGSIRKMGLCLCCQRVLGHVFVNCVLQLTKISVNFFVYIVQRGM